MKKFIEYIKDLRKKDLELYSYKDAFFTVSMMFGGLISSILILQLIRYGIKI